METHSSDPSSIIRVEDGSAFHAQTNWIMAGLVLGAAGLVVWFFRESLSFDFNSPNFNPVVFLPIFLGAYGLKHLILSVVATLRAKRFGLSVLEIQGPIVRMGQTIKGVVRAPVELRPLADYVISLQCIETFEMQGGSAEGSTKGVDRIRWEASTRVGPASANSRTGIPFEFTLPRAFEKSPPSKPGSLMTSAVAAIHVPGMQGVFSHNRAPMATRWVLEIKAPLKGIDYYAIFGVIVQAATQD